MRHTIAIKRSNGQMTTITPQNVNDMERQALSLLYTIWRAQGRHELVELVKQARRQEKDT